MVNIFKKIIFFYLIGVNIQCSYHATPKNIKDIFPLCYSNKMTKLDTKININGYFMMLETYDRYDNGYRYHKIDTSYNHMMFYEDGIVIGNFWAISAKGEHLSNDSTESFLEKIYNEKSPKLSKLFYENFIWGIYSLNEDTINIKCLYRPQKGESSFQWYTVQSSFKIIDKNTLLEINPNKKNKSIPIAKFIPLLKKPAPDCWLKKEKWFWCNQNEWKEYIERK